MTKIFDHANHAFFYGLRMLTLGWTDGNTFLPVNHVLLSSENKSQNNEDKGIDQRCNGYRRRKLALSKGTEAIIELIKETKKALLPADYVLFDSWFTSPKTLIAVKALGYDVIAMIKRTERTR